MITTIANRFKLGIVISFALLGARPVWSIPLLQLDIGGGTYIGGTDETTYAQGSSFSLYALYSGSTAPSGKFYISAAIQPRQTQATIQPNFGTFTINGTPYSTGLAYGLPPVAVTDGAPKVQDLGSHDVFPTYYAEFEFEFGTSQAALYNVVASPGGPLAHLGTGLYYQEFIIDVSGLLNTYSLHFDLYNETVKNVGSKQLPVTAMTMGDFGPFSHDAQSGPGGFTGNRPVPDGGSTLLLLGAGILGVVLLRPRFVIA